MKKIFIALILFFLNGCNQSLEMSSENIEEKYNIYISKLSNEQIQENLNKGLKPIAIKDNIDVQGFANTAGSIALKNNFPDNNAFLIQKLVDNGYFVIGKQIFLNGLISAPLPQQADGLAWEVKPSIPMERCVLHAVLVQAQE